MLNLIVSVVQTRFGLLPAERLDTGRTVNCTLLFCGKITKR